MSNLQYTKQDVLEWAVQLQGCNSPLPMFIMQARPRCLWPQNYVSLPSEWLDLQRMGYTSCGKLCSGYPTLISSQWCLVWNARCLKPMTSSRRCVFALEIPEFHPPEPGQHLAAQNALLPYPKTTMSDISNMPTAVASQFCRHHLFNLQQQAYKVGICPLFCTWGRWISGVGFSLEYAIAIVSKLQKKCI